MGSVELLSCQTRPYHGLLTPATKPPVGRDVLLSKPEDAIGCDERRNTAQRWTAEVEHCAARHPLSFSKNHVVAGMELRIVDCVRNSVWIAEHTRSTCRRKPGEFHG